MNLYMTRLSDPKVVDESDPYQQNISVNLRREEGTVTD